MDVTSSAARPTPALWSETASRRAIGAMPAADDVVVTAIGLSALCAELEIQGVDGRRALEPLGLAAAQLDDPDARITLRRKIGFFRAVHRLARDPAIGLDAARRLRLNDFGILGFAVSAQASFEEALRFGLAHARLGGSILERTYRREGRFGIVAGHDVHEFRDLLPLVVEYSLAKMLRLVELVMERPVPPVQILLPYAKPPHGDLYARHFGCDVRFEAGVIECRYAEDVLGLACPNASELSRRMAEEPCRRLLGSLSGAEPAIVRAIRLECLKGSSRGSLPQADEIAERLNLSRRTLARRLAEVGTGWQEIVDDVRGRLARELLANTALTNDEIAARLGFADASSFGKSFKRWAGVTPVEYRRRGATPAAAASGEPPTANTG